MQRVAEFGYAAVLVLAIYLCVQIVVFRVSDECAMDALARVEQGDSMEQSKLCHRAHRLANRMAGVW